MCPEKTTDQSQATDKFYHILMYPVQLSWPGFELKALVVLGTDCIGYCKSNYHKITTTTAHVSVTPLVFLLMLYFLNWYLLFTVKPYFPVKYESQILVRDGDHIGLSCIPDGDPKPTVTWTVPKHMVTIEWALHIICPPPTSKLKQTWPY